MRCRRRPRTGPAAAAATAALCVASSGLVTAGPATVLPIPRTPRDHGHQVLNAGALEQTEVGGRLAVVVPVYDGDLEKSLESMALWPKVCHQETLSKVELVLYKAEREEEGTRESLQKALEETAGECFAETKIVYANLKDEDNVYPKGPSMQFYKLFLDDDVRRHFTKYDAISIIEWDVLVARETSFKQLYHASFNVPEPFWVKGSVLAGTNFHNTAVNADMWHVLGHINGNAIYNNNDPDFVEFVEYTLARWDYQYPYDVALWATISDFPYSWPLWQRYSTKFVTTNLIANVGYENVDVDTLGTALAGDTLFIHGSRIEGSNRDTDGKVGAETVEAILPCDASCGSSEGLPDGMSTVCDASCHSDGRFGGHLCGAGNSARYGSSCRLCYTDQVAALAAEADLRKRDSEDNEGKHVIMCDTMRPPAALECDDKCALKADTVCDYTCGTGRFGDYNCNWRNHGATCRYCFHDLQTALVSDEVAQRHGGRVIMCDTHEPPQPMPEVAPVKRMVAATRRLSSNGKGGIRKRKSGQKWKKQKKWKRSLTTAPDSDVPGCEDTCSYTDDNSGRVCDSSCSDPNPVYGTDGCGISDGLYGAECRACYTDLEEARSLHSNGQDVVMCDTLSPPDGYARRYLAGVPRGSRRLTSSSGGCEDTCSYIGENSGRVCDSSCSDPNPVYGTDDCGISDGLYGAECRACYIDLEEARSLQSNGQDVIMCDTLSPPDGYARRYLAGVPHGSRRLKGSSGGDEGDAVPERKANKKWKAKRNRKYGVSKMSTTTDDSLDDADTPDQSGCEASCPISDDHSGRVCDPTCADDDPVYGRGGCGTEDGSHGTNCRECFHDLATAQERARDGEEVIMCDTLAPPDAYVPGRRQLTPVAALATEGEIVVDSGGANSWAHEPFVGGIERDNICAFIGSDFGLLEETEVSVKSVMEFMPGVRVAIAVAEEDLAVFEQTFEEMSWVSVSVTRDPGLSALIADQYCGADADLIYYLTPGTLVSRTFSSKDTHSPRGDLLVVYSEGRGADRATLASALTTSALLGFEAPLFTYGTDLILPSYVNGELARAIVPDGGDVGGERVLEVVAEFDHVNAAEVLAAFAYSRNFEGIWFLNPQKWVTQHLFKAASIWDIPLVKPRFSCSLDPSLDLEELDLKYELSEQLGRLVGGATCESGYLNIDWRSLH